MNKYQTAWMKILEHDDKVWGQWTPRVREILLDNEKQGNLVDEVAVIQDLINDCERLYHIESALHALLGLSDENDGYLACAVKHHDGTFGFASEEMFRTVDDLRLWYEETFPEEI